MRWISFLLLACLLDVQANTERLAFPQSLKMLYLKARPIMADIEAEAERIEQNKAREKQLKGAMLPQLTARYNYTEIDPLPNPNAFTRINQYNVSVNLTQPLYRAGSFSAYTQAQKQSEAQRFLFLDRELNLWRMVIDVYYRAWRFTLDEKNARELVKLSEQRLSDLKGRAKVGRSRQGEYLQAKAQLSQAKAEWARLKVMLSEIQEELKFFGSDYKELQFPELSSLQSTLESKEWYLDKLKERPDVRALSLNQDIARESIAIAKAGHHPRLDFNTNYFFLRTGVLEDSRYDFGLTFSFPLFQGGTVAAQVKEALSVEREVRLRQAQREREIQRELLALWESSRNFNEVVHEWANAAREAELTYQENKKDYNFGVVTNLELIQSLNQFIETRRAYQQAHVEQDRQIHLLSIAAGVKP
jgi:outer membrane protein TolC